MENLKQTVLIVLLAFLAAGIFFALLRAFIGPRRADRIMGINMLGTMSTASIAVLAVLLQEKWLLDVSLVYALISFLAVMVLGKIHISEAENDPAADSGKEAGND